MQSKSTLAAVLVAAVVLPSQAFAGQYQNGGCWMGRSHNPYRFGYSTGYGMVPGFWYAYEDDPCWVWTPEGRVWVCYQRDCVKTRRLPAPVKILPPSL